MFRRLFYYRPFMERTLCHFLRQRLSLSMVTLDSLYKDAEEIPITIRKLPKGSWSTPLSDLVMLLKLAMCAKPQQLMEVGSFRGYTALYLAQHIAPNARVVSIDCNPAHGEAYLHTPYSAQIERRVGVTSPEMFSGDEPQSYDLIFLDADHAYNSVQYDTELLMPLLAPNGYFVWHDYANWGYFDGKNGVPEFLNQLAKRLPIMHVLGTDLAICSPNWMANDWAVYHDIAQNRSPSLVGADPWGSDTFRG